MLVSGVLGSGEGRGRLGVPKPSIAQMIWPRRMLMILRIGLAVWGGALGRVCHVLGEEAHEIVSEGHGIACVRHCQHLWPTASGLG